MSSKILGQTENRSVELDQYQDLKYLNKLRFLLHSEKYSRMQILEPECLD